MPAADVARRPADDRRATLAGSGCCRFPQDQVQRTLELEFFLFHLLDFHAMRSHDAGFHVLDLLVELVVAMKDPGEVVILNLEARNQISVLWEHSILLTGVQDEKNWNLIIFPPS